MADALAWLAEATRAGSASVDLAAARRRLEARLSSEASPWARVGQGARGKGRGARGLGAPCPVPRAPYRWRWFWPVLALAATAMACLVLLLGQGYLTRPAPKLQEVRFDSSLWELDRIADATMGRATAEMTDWPGR